MDDLGDDEELRLAALAGYGILDTDPDPAFDDLARVAAFVCNAPMATVTLVDRDRQWFKAEIGVGERETPRNISFCTVAIQRAEPLVVEDALDDERFRESPLVTGPLHLRAYAGVPLTSPDGHRIGTLCVLDSTARPFDARQRDALRLLGGQAEELLELHRQRQAARRNADELGRTSRHLDEAQRIAAVGSWEVEFEPYRTWWSDGYYRILDAERGSIDETLETYESFVHPDDLDEFRAARARAVESGERLDVEHRIVWRDGTVRWVHELAEFVDLQEGRRRQAGTVQDVTDRRRTEDLLREQDYLTRIASALLRMGGWAIDLDTKHITWSDAVCLLHEVPPGTSPEYERASSFYAPEWRPRMREAYFACVHTGQPFDLEVEIVTATGRRRWVRSVGEAVRSDDGTIHRVHGAFIDLTEQHDLEQQVSQLQRLESLGQLTGGVAHDFNNLLTVIIGNAELLSMSLDESGELHSLAGMIRTAGERGAQLTSRLLAFARRQALEPRIVDPVEMIRGMRSLLERTLGEHVEITLHHDPGVWPIEVDPAQLESALLNVAINARDAMPSGGHLVLEASNVVIDTSYAAQHVEVEPGHYVVIAVSDTGGGMSPETRSRAFEPFFTTKPTGRGSGLGLSMVYGFTKQSGGHVHLYSEPGHGTTVKLYLPRVDGAAHVAPPTRADDAVIGGSETILLVEDDDLVRAHATHLLRELGYDVHVASNGPDALSLVEQIPHLDLLFTDVVMPGGLNGPQLAAEITARRPGTRVLYTSGYTENAIVHHGRVDAGVELLHKPYRRSELAAKIRAALDRTSA